MGEEVILETGHGLTSQVPDLDFPPAECEEKVIFVQENERVGGREVFHIMRPSTIIFRRIEAHRTTSIIESQYLEVTILLLDKKTFVEELDEVQLLAGFKTVLKVVQDTPITN